MKFGKLYKIGLFIFLLGLVIFCVGMYTTIHVIFAGMILMLVGGIIWNPFDLL